MYMQVHVYVCVHSMECFCVTIDNMGCHSAGIASLVFFYLRQCFSLTRTD